MIVNIMKYKQIKVIALNASLASQIKTKNNAYLTHVTGIDKS